MGSRSLLSDAREAAGLSKTDLAERAHTSRTTLSAYEHGVDLGGGRTASVADGLPDLSVRDALRTLEMPLHLDWSRSAGVVDLADRAQRARAYEVALREGRPVDIESIVDGALLVDLWDDLVLPIRLRDAWQPTIDRVRPTNG